MPLHLGEGLHNLGDRYQWMSQPSGPVNYPAALDLVRPNGWINKVDFSATH